MKGSLDILGAWAEEPPAVPPTATTSSDLTPATLSLKIGRLGTRDRACQPRFSHAHQRGGAAPEPAMNCAATSNC